MTTKMQSWLQFLWVEVPYFSLCIKSSALFKLCGLMNWVNGFVLRWFDNEQRVKIISTIDVWISANVELVTKEDIENRK